MFLPGQSLYLEVYQEILDRATLPSGVANAFCIGFRLWRHVIHSTSYITWAKWQFSTQGSQWHEVKSFILCNGSSKLWNQRFNNHYENILPINLWFSETDRFVNQPLLIPAQKISPPPRFCDGSQTTLVTLFVLFSIHMKLQETSAKRTSRHSLYCSNCDVHTRSSY